VHEREVLLDGVDDRGGLDIVGGRPVRLGAAAREEGDGRGQGEQGSGGAHEISSGSRTSAGPQGGGPRRWVGRAGAEGAKVRWGLRRGPGARDRPRRTRGSSGGAARAASRREHGARGAPSAVAPRRAATTAGPPTTAPRRRPRRPRPPPW